MVSTVKELINTNNGCSLPWLHTEINLQGGSVWPCCKYKTSLGNPVDFKKIWYGQDFQKLREHIINNISHDSCSKCNVNENEFSYKKFKNIDYQLRYNIKLNPVELPRVFHFSLKNVCNLACRMCNSNSSSKFYDTVSKSEFFKRTFDIRPVDNRFDVKQLSGIFSNASQILFSGGEPMLDDDVLEIVKMASSESNQLRQVFFSTNMTVYNSKLIDELKKLKLIVMFSVSIDGPKFVQEYIRHGSSLDKIIENIIRLKEINPRFCVNSTISCLNAGYMPELIDTLHYIQDVAGIRFKTIMTSPVLEKQLHAGSLPDEVKELYKTKLKDYKYKHPMIQGEETLINTALGLMSSETYSWEETELFLKEFDKLTKTDYRSVYPELGALKR
jgi:MoaA/NifB/PqqE/SkfB family radical SAM enzyme